MNFELFIARRLSESKLNRNYYSGPIIRICMLTICISMAVIIITVCTGLGLKFTITQNIINAESDIQISSINQLEETSFILMNKDELSNINDIIGIKSVNPIVKKSAIVNKNDNIHGIILKGIELEYKEGLINQHIIEGRYFNDNTKNELLISSEQARKMKIQVNETCLLYFLSKNNNIQKRKFLIIGIYDMKNELFNENYSFAKKSDIQKINNWETNQVSNYEITVENPKETEQITEKINNNLPYNLMAKSITSRFSGLFNWIKLFDKNILVILIIMCVICVINMSNTLFVLILERLKMIGILKSLGSLNKSIMKIFIYNSLKIATKSILVGNIIGILLCLIQQKTHFIQLNPESYFVNYLPIIIDFEFILLINIITFIIILTSVIIPYYIIKNLSVSSILKIN